MTATLRPPDGFYEAITAYVRNASAANPNNTAKMFQSSVDSQVGWDGLASLDLDLTTPETTPYLWSRKVDSDKTGSPGYYEWGPFSYLVTTGTAPVTALAGRARGNTVYTLSSSGRAYGKDPQIHGVEITAGLHPSQAIVTTSFNSPILQDIAVTQDGSRFEQGMAISGTGIPGGTTISSVTGRPGAPSTITMSAPASASASAVPVAAQPVGTTEAIGLLITGNCGSSAINDLLDAAVQIQAQNGASAWQYGVNIGASGLQAGGIAFRLASATADKALSVESCTLANGFYVSNTTFSGGAVAMSGVTAPYAMHIASGSLTISAIQIDVDAPIRLGNAVGAGKGFLELWEQTADPAAPPADSGRLFMKDNGAGKTQLVVRFPTGATQVIATQP